MQADFCSAGIEKIAQVSISVLLIYSKFSQIFLKPGVFIAREAKK